MLHMCKQMQRMIRTMRLRDGCNSYVFLNMKNQNVCWTNQITTHNIFIWVLEKNQQTMFRTQAALQRENFNKCFKRQNITKHQCSRNRNNRDCHSRRALLVNIYLDLDILSSQQIFRNLRRPSLVFMLRKFLWSSVSLQIIKT